MSHVHINQGKYRGKHPSSTDLDERIASEISLRAEDAKLPCAAASHLATKLGASMEAVGRNADLLEIKISKCQLGLFGYPQTEGKSRIMKPAETVSSELEHAIRHELEDGKLPCALAWKIAERFGIGKLAVCSAADAIDIKTSRCQLGAF